MDHFGRDVSPKSLARLSCGRFEFKRCELKEVNAFVEEQRLTAVAFGRRDAIDAAEVATRWSFGRGQPHRPARIRTPKKVRRASELSKRNERKTQKLNSTMLEPSLLVCCCFAAHTQVCRGATSAVNWSRCAVSNRCALLAVPPTYAWRE